MRSFKLNPIYQELRAFCRSYRAPVMMSVTAENDLIDDFLQTQVVSAPTTNNERNRPVLQALESATASCQ
jgi:hypothetical protein